MEGARRIFINTDWFCSGGTRADSAQLRQCAGRRMFAREHFSENYPEGIVSSSPGLRGTSYPGKTSRIPDNPNGVVSLPRGRPATPSGLGKIYRSATQGSSCLATLGFGPESPWDSRSSWHRGEPKAPEDSRTPKPGGLLSIFHGLVPRHGLACARSSASSFARAAGTS